MAASDPSAPSALPPAPAPDVPAAGRAPGVFTPFRSLRHRNYRLYFFGQLVSLTGMWMQSAALIWVMFRLTGQSKWAGSITIAQVLPTFLFGAWGGTIADRYPKRTVLLWTQSILLGQALALALLVY